MNYKVKIFARNICNPRQRNTQVKNTDHVLEAGVVTLSKETPVCVRFHSSHHIWTAVYTFHSRSWAHNRPVQDVTCPCMRRVLCCLPPPLSCSSTRTCYTCMPYGIYSSPLCSLFFSCWVYSRAVQYMIQYGTVSHDIIQEHNAIYYLSKSQQKLFAS